MNNLVRMVNEASTSDDTEVRKNFAPLLVAATAVALSNREELTQKTPEILHWCTNFITSHEDEIVAYLKTRLHMRWGDPRCIEWHWVLHTGAEEDIETMIGSLIDTADSCVRRLWGAEFQTGSMWQKIFKRATEYDLCTETFEITATV